MDLTNVDMPWHSFQLSNLISLSVENVRNPFQPTMVEHLSTLRSMHDLVDLHLCDALPSARSFLADAIKFHLNVIVAMFIIMTKETNTGAAISSSSLSILEEP